MFPLFILGLVPVGDADADDLLENINRVVRNDVVGKPLSFISEVDGCEVFRDLGQVLARASSTSLLESEVLNCDEPG